MGNTIDRVSNRKGHNMRTDGVGKSNIDREALAKDIEQKFTSFTGGFTFKEVLRESNLKKHNVAKEKFEDVKTSLNGMVHGFQYKSEWKSETYYFQREGHDVIVARAWKGSGLEREEKARFFDARTGELLFSARIDFKAKNVEFHNADSSSS